MIGQLIQYSAIASKVRAMYGRRLKPEDFSRLVSMKNVSEIVAYLKTHPGWAPALADANTGDVHRGELESRLRLHLLNEYQRIFKFMSSNDQSIMQYPLLRTDLDQIMHFLRYFKAGRPQDYVFSAPAFYKLHSRIDFDAFHECFSYTSFLDVLKDTEFYPSLVALSPPPGAPINYTAIDNVLSSYYFHTLIESIDKNYHGKIRSLLRKSVGMQIDLLNIARSIRLRRYFGDSTTDVLPYMIPVYTSIKPEFLRALFAADSEDQETALLQSSPYRRVFNNNDFPHIEDYYYRRLYQFNRHLISSGTPSVYTPIAYLTLKEIELKDLINVIEIVRYQVTPEDASVNIEGLTD